MYYTPFTYYLDKQQSDKSDCPPDKVIGVTSPENRTATLEVTFRDMKMRITRPVGTYHYEVLTEADNYCSLTVDIKGQISTSFYVLLFISMTDVPRLPSEQKF